MKHKRQLLTGACVVLAAAIGLSIFHLPAPRPATAPAESFSAARALAHVEAIAQAPHPSGSSENAKVRAYVVQQMRELGLEPRELPGAIGEKTFVNLYGVLRGSSSAAPAVLLVSHYDSTSRGPGAADAASCVATLLETLRALKAQGQIEHSLGLLITDREEGGMVGARGFVADAPDLLSTVRFVINLEARGNSGPVLMFQLSPNCRSLVSLYRRACPQPIAMSLSQDVYQRLPNDTDFTVFAAAGKAGLNFAFIDGLAYYHSPRDVPANLDRRTLQHYGSTLLGLATWLAQNGVDDVVPTAASAEQVYFTVLPRLLLQYPVWLAKGLAVLAAVGWLLELIRQRAAARIRVRGIALGTAYTLAAAAVAGLVGLAVVLGWAWKFGSLRRFPFIVHERSDILLLFVLVVAAWWCGQLFSRRLLRRVNAGEGRLGALLPWAVLTLATAFLLPGASYLFVWPTLFGLLAIALAIRDVRTPARQAMVTLATCIPAPLLFAPVVLLLHQALTVGIAPLSLMLVALAAPLASCWQKEEPPIGAAPAR